MGQKDLHLEMYGLQISIHHGQICGSFGWHILTQHVSSHRAQQLHKPLRNIRPP